MAAPDLARLIAYFESLDEPAIARIGDYYAEHAYFKDPFNEVRGAHAIGVIFARMYAQLDDPRFRVLGRLCEGEEAFLIWDLEFRFRGRPAPQKIHGVTHLRFGADGRVLHHRDYWDTAEELYAKSPGLGVAVRWLQRRAG